MVQIWLFGKGLARMVFDDTVTFEESGIPRIVKPSLDRVKVFNVKS